MDLKEKIAEAFIKLCAKEGVENVTLQKVAALSQTAYSTVHYHFGQRTNDLLNAGFERVGGSSLAFIEKHLSVILADPKTSSLAAYIESKFTWQQKHPNYASLWVYFLYMTTRSKKTRTENHEAYLFGLNRIKGLLIQDVGKGYLTMPTHLDHMASRIEQAIVGGLILAVTTNSRYEQALGEVQETVLEILGKHVRYNLFTKNL